MGLMWESADQALRPIATATAEHAGRFIWSEYWSKWDEVLACQSGGAGQACWTVRGLDDGRVRRHSTQVPLDCIHSAPDIVDGRHIAPLALPNLAVLRAGIDGQGARSYFGSRIGLGHWLADTQRRGLVDDGGLATAAGLALGSDLALTSLPSLRATLWPDAAQLVQRGAALARAAALRPAASSEV